MSEIWLGLVVSGESVAAVQADVPKGGLIRITGDETVKLQKGDRAVAYALLHKRISDIVQENKVNRVFVKASAVGQNRPTLAHLHAAEVRGVVVAAAAGVTTVALSSMAHISKNFGERKSAEYIADSDFWDQEVEGDLRSGSREAALLLLAARKI